MVLLLQSILLISVAASLNGSTPTTDCRSQLEILAGLSDGETINLPIRAERPRLRLERQGDVWSLMPDIQYLVAEALRLDEAGGGQLPNISVKHNGRSVDLSAGSALPLVLPAGDSFTYDGEEVRLPSDRDRLVGRGPYIRYKAGRNLGVVVSRAHRFNNQDFFPLDHGYFRFAERLGWIRDTGNPNIDIEKVRLLYAEAERDAALDDLPLYPALLLQKDGDPRTYFAKPWARIPNGYHPMDNPYIDDRVERALNALGFFSFSEQGNFGAHDLFGHIRVYFDRRSLSSALKGASQRMFPGLKLLTTDDGIHYLETPEIMRFNDLRAIHRVLIASELSAAVKTSDSRSIFEKISLLNQVPADWNLRDRLADLIRLKELSSRGFAEKHAEALVDFYRREIVLTGGVAGDNDRRATSPDYSDSSGLFVSRLNNTHLSVLAEMLMTKHSVKSVESRALVIASFETLLDFWTRFTPEDVLNSVMQETQGSFDMEVSALHRQVFSYLVPDKLFGSDAWLPAGYGAEALTIRREYWTRLFNYIANNPDKVEDFASAMIPSVQNSLSSFAESDPIILGAFRNLSEKNLPTP